MGFIGCSMAKNVAQGYVAVGGQRMWGPYGTGGMVVQSWTDTNSSSWRLFDQQATRYGRPSAGWVQICILAQNGATHDEVKRLIANARQHAASGATQNVTYPGTFRLRSNEVADGCHANTTGQASLGRQALAFWG